MKRHRTEQQSHLSHSRGGEKQNRPESPYWHNKEENQLKKPENQMTIKEGEVRKPEGRKYLIIPLRRKPDDKGGGGRANGVEA